MPSPGAASHLGPFQAEEQASDIYLYPLWYFIDPLLIIHAGGSARAELLRWQGVVIFRELSPESRGGALGALGNTPRACRRAERVRIEGCRDVSMVPTETLSEAENVRESM